MLSYIDHAVLYPENGLGVHRAASHGTSLVTRLHLERSVFSLAQHLIAEQAECMSGELPVVRWLCARTQLGKSCMKLAL